MSRSYDKLIWVDLEMTGLDVETCQILEIAVVITDADLDIIAETSSIAIQSTEEALKNMNAWCLKVHNNSGLVERCLKSQINVTQAEEIVMDFLLKYTIPGESPLCGNCVWQDRRFLEKYMPSLEQYFTHQHFDLGTFRIAMNMWKKQEISFKNQGAHLALIDIKEHIEEVKYYKHILVL